MQYSVLFKLDKTFEVDIRIAPLFRPKTHVFVAHLLLCFGYGDTISRRYWYTISRAL